MESRKYNPWILHTVCISAALICIVLTFWGNFKSGGVITIDAYIGVMATFIGICAAIVVGFQLYSYFEFRSLKERIDKAEALKNEWDDEMHITKKGVANAFRLLYRLNRANPISPVMTVVSILTYDLKRIDKDTSRFMRSRYRQLDYMLGKCNYNHRLLKKYIPDLRAMEIPKELEHYKEIIKLHQKVISGIENA